MTEDANKIIIKSEVGTGRTTGCEQDKRDYTNMMWRIRRVKTAVATVKIMEDLANKNFSVPRVVDFYTQATSLTIWRLQNKIINARRAQGIIQAISDGAFKYLQSLKETDSVKQTAELILKGKING